MNEFVRSTWLPVSRWSNVNKLQQLRSIHSEYVRVVREMIDVLWQQEKIAARPRYLDYEVHKTSFLSKALIATAGHDAATIIIGMRRSAKRLKKTAAKPQIRDDHPMRLHGMFIRIKTSDRATHFNAWITVMNLFHQKAEQYIRRYHVDIPVNFNRHVNKLLDKGELRQYVIFDGRRVGLAFRCKAEQRASGSTLGIDVGIADVITASDGQHGNPHPHGWSLSQIQQRLARRKKGSRGFRCAQDLRANFINWSLNQLNLTNVSTLVIEDIKHLRRGRPCDRFRSHWTYTKIFDKLNMLAEEHGVRVVKVNPAYTSQTCSSCGAVDRDSRSGKHFRCVHCGFECDADLNAAINISLVGEALAVPRVERNEIQAIS